MSIDLERDLRDMMQRTADGLQQAPVATPGLVRRARLHRARTAIVTGVAVLALVLGGFAASRSLSNDQAIPPADPLPPTNVRTGALAYGLDGDIYVADWDGSDPVRIADGRPPSEGKDDCEEGTSRVNYYGFGPIWSPDGRYLAYWRCVWGTVLINDPRGNLVASIPGDGWLISWSPDSTRVAVWISWGKTIGIYGLDGVRQAILTLPRGLMAPGDFDPVWSRDGESLLVPHGVEIPLDGGTPRQLPSDDPRARDATFSPDGSRAAYSDFGLFVSAADGSDAQQLVGDWTDSPVWSPTGDRIAFAYSSDGETRPYATELRVIDIATGKMTSLADMGDSTYLRVIDFSSEGDRILFSRVEDEFRGVRSIWSVRSDGSGLRRLVEGSDWADWQSVSPAR